MKGRKNSMSNNEAVAERRKSKRFRGKDGTYAILRGPTKKLAQIVDVSKSGLSFRYIDIGDRPKRLLELDLLLKANGFQLEKVSFKTIFDLEATKEMPFTSTPLRRRGGQFVALTPKQISALEYFIQNHTVGEVETVHPRDSRESRGE